MALFNREGGPRQDNRPPLRGRVDLGVSAPPRPDGRVVAPDRPAPPPVQPHPDRAQHGPEQRPEKPKHTGRNIALAGTGLLGLGGLAAWTAYETIPAFHQMVDQAFLSHLRGDQLVSTDTKPDAIFDNSRKEPEITDRNSALISLDQFKNSDTPSSYDPATQTFTNVLPFAVPEGVEIDYKKYNFIDAGGYGAPGPDTPYWHPQVQFLDRDGKPAEGVGIITSDDGWHATVGKGVPEWGGDEKYAVSVSLFKYFPEQKVTVVIGIIDPSVSLKPNISMIDSRKTKITDYETQLPELPKGTILATTTNATKLPFLMEVRIYEGKNIAPGKRKLIQDADPALYREAQKVLIVTNQ